MHTHCQFVGGPLARQMLHIEPGKYFIYAMVERARWDRMPAIVQYDCREIDGFGFRIFTCRGV